MTHIIVNVIYFLTMILLLVATVWIVFSLLRSTLFGHAPFIPVMDHAIDPILSELDLGQDSLFIEIGCGNGKVLVAATQKFPQTKMIGIEHDLVPYFIARFNTRKLPNVSIVRQNFFSYDFSKATHLFAYLLPGVMDDLGGKLDRELQPGTILVSCDFKISRKQPLRIVTVSAKKSDLAKNLFIYKW
ncbi:MAG: putative methyltransferase [Patescibacteria group bacterium]|nr:putative methyltransferase [Patescibacteria group bacterium]